MISSSSAVRTCAGICVTFDGRSCKAGRDGKAGSTFDSVAARCSWAAWAISCHVRAGADIGNDCGMMNWVLVLGTKRMLGKGVWEVGMVFLDEELWICLIWQ